MSSSLEVPSHLFSIDGHVYFTHPSAAYEQNILYVAFSLLSGTRNEVSERENGEKGIRRATHHSATTKPVPEPAKPFPRASWLRWTPERQPWVALIQCHFKQLTCFGLCKVYPILSYRLDRMLRTFLREIGFVLFSDGTIGPRMEWSPSTSRPALITNDWDMGHINDDNNDGEMNMSPEQMERACHIIYRDYCNRPFADALERHTARATFLLVRAMKLLERYNDARTDLFTRLDKLSTAMTTAAQQLPIDNRASVSMSLEEATEHVCTLRNLVFFLYCHEMNYVEFALLGQDLTMAESDVALFGLLGVARGGSWRERAYDQALLSAQETGYLSARDLEPVMVNPASEAFVGALHSVMSVHSAAQKQAVNQSLLDPIQIVLRDVTILHQKLVEFDSRKGDTT